MINRINSNSRVRNILRSILPKLRRVAFSLFLAMLVSIFRPPSPFPYPGSPSYLQLPVPAPPQYGHHPPGSPPACPDTWLPPDRSSPGSPAILTRSSPPQFHHSPTREGSGRPPVWRPHRYRASAHPRSKSSGAPATNAPAVPSAGFHRSG